MKFPSLAFSLVLLALSGFGLLAHAQEKGARAESKGADNKDPAATRGGAAAEEEEGKGLQIGKLLPLNKPNLRVKIPGFDEGGGLASMIEAEKLTRIDDSNLKLEDATIQLLPQELTIKLRSALYNTDAAILSSNQKTTVSSKQFTMTGDTMDFDTRTGKGRMTARPDGTGIVRMIIHNVDDMGGGSKKTTTATATTKTKTEEVPKK
jgi:hypothetical protein